MNSRTEDCRKQCEYEGVCKTDEHKDSNKRGKVALVGALRDAVLSYITLDIVHITLAT